MTKRLIGGMAACLLLVTGLVVQAKDTHSITTISKAEQAVLVSLDKLVEEGDASSLSARQAIGEKVVAAVRAATSKGSIKVSLAGYLKQVEKAGAALKAANTDAASIKAMSALEELLFAHQAKFKAQ